MWYCCLAVIERIAAMDERTILKTYSVGALREWILNRYRGSDNA